LKKGAVCSTDTLALTNQSIRCHNVNVHRNKSLGVHVHRVTKGPIAGYFECETVRYICVNLTCFARLKLLKHIINVEQCRSDHIVNNVSKLSSILSSEGVTTNMNCIIRNTDFICVIKISYWLYHISRSLNLYTFKGGWLHNYVLQMFETHFIQNVFASLHLYHTMFHNDNLLRSEIIFQFLMTGVVGAISSEFLIRLQKLLQLRPHRTTKCKRCKYLIQPMELHVVDFCCLSALIMAHSFPALETARMHHLSFQC
jgi:hypothetical protein